MGSKNKIHILLLQKSCNLTVLNLLKISNFKTFHFEILGILCIFSF